MKASLLHYTRRGSL